MTDALLIFAKAPLPGEVKTRLITDLTKEEAARLYEAFIYDILNSTSRIGAERFLFCHPAIDHTFFQGISNDMGIRLMEQKGRDLGERMENAMSLLFGYGFNRVIIIGADSPTLPIEYIEEGFKGLIGYQIVIGPSIDGGYYLIGARDSVPSIFDGIPWGTKMVFRMTLEKGASVGSGLYILPFWYDIDTIDDLSLMFSHVRYLNRNGEGIAEETMKLLGKMVIFKDQSR